MKEYYIIEDEERQGPFTLEELKSKTILPDTHIWEENFDDWKKVSEIPELAVLIKKTPPPIPKKKTPPPIPTVKKKKNPPPLPNALKTPPPPPISSIGTEGETNNGKNSYGVSKDNIDDTDNTKMPKTINSSKEEKSGSNFFKNKWFYIIGGILLIVFISSIFNDGDNSHQDLSTSECDELIDGFGDFIVSKVFSGGSNVREINRGCESVRNGYLINLECNFNGNLTKHSKYYFYASVNLKHDGSYIVEFKNMDASAKWWYYEIKGFANNTVEFDKNGVMLTQTKN